MAQYITTYTGIHFCPTEPDADGIRIEDIAHSLSMLCRANGHYKEFYSVADHSIDCAVEAQARGLGPYTAMVCLLHDAAEAYTSDIPRPVKRELHGIYSIEERLAVMIYEKFAGKEPTHAELAEVKKIDDAMLFQEFRKNMGEKLGHGETVSKRSFVSRPPKKSEQEFLELFEKIKHELEKADD